MFGLGGDLWPVICRDGSMIEIKSSRIQGFCKNGGFGRFLFKALLVKGLNRKFQAEFKPKSSRI